VQPQPGQSQEKRSQARAAVIDSEEQTEGIRIMPGGDD
jgi:hypothetical protein